MSSLKIALVGPQMSKFLHSWQEGGCHCGSVRFKVWIDTLDVLECNCSMCVKKGFINLIAEAVHFELLAGEAYLENYQFNTRVAEHKFCRQCGIHPFSRPRSHPGSYDVNASCLDAGFNAFNITPFDGENWEANVDTIR
jgi:hypothetical protein